MMQAEKLEWSAVQNNDRITVRLGGWLSRDTLLPLWKAIQQRQQRFAFLSQTLPAHSQIVWDLSQLQRIDSAGFAMLCDALNQCRQLGVSVIIEQAPNQLFTLADLFGLEQWLSAFIPVKA